MNGECRMWVDKVISPSAADTCNDRPLPSESRPFAMLTQAKFSNGRKRASQGLLAAGERPEILLTESASYGHLILWPSNYSFIHYADEIG